MRRRTVGRIGGVYGWALGGCLQQGHTGSHSVATVTAWWRCGCGKTATARGYASTGKAGTYRGLRHPSSTRRWQAQGRARQRRRRQQGTRCIGSETKCSKNHFITTNYLHGSLSSPFPSGSGTHTVHRAKVLPQRTTPKGRASQAASISQTRGDPKVKPAKAPSAKTRAPSSLLGPPSTRALRMRRASGGLLFPL